MAQKKIVDSGKTDNCKFSIYRTGGGRSILSTRFVLVEPAEDIDENWSVKRHFYGDEQTVFDERRFAKKVCRDEEYRKRCVEGNVGWVVVSDILREVEIDLMSAFMTGKIDYDEARDYIEESYRYLCSEVYESENMDVSEQDVLLHLSLDLVSRAI